MIRNIPVNRVLMVCLMVAFAALYLKNLLYQPPGELQPNTVAQAQPVPANQNTLSYTKPANNAGNDNFTNLDSHLATVPAKEGTGETPPRPNR